MQDWHARALLIFASASQNRDLLEIGANPNEINQDKHKTPLLVMATKVSTPVCFMFLGWPGTCAIINTKQKQHTHNRHSPGKMNWQRIVNTLIEFSVDVNITDAVSLSS